MTIMADPPLPVTRRAALDLSRQVQHAARPCRRPGADPEAWFPEEPQHDPVADPTGAWHTAECERLERRARALCRFCPVELACLELAIRDEDITRGHGIFGGTTPLQRQQIKASRIMAGLVVRRG